MHPNPAFRATPEAESLDFAREAGFGMLTVSTEGAPLVSHIPFILNETGDLAEFHLVRSNPIARMLGTARPVRLAVEGPNGYISPDWYGVEEQVPTWNYVAVHLVGMAETRPAETLRDLLDRQSAVFEGRLAPKPVWTMDKMTPDIRDRMLRQIVPCAMRIEDIQGTWKLGQNKSDEARLRAARHLDATALGCERRVLAALMSGASPRSAEGETR